MGIVENQLLEISLRSKKSYRNRVINERNQIEESSSNTISEYGSAKEDRNFQNFDQLIE